MQFDLYIILRGPARTLEIPNSSNPVEAPDLASLLVQLSENLPSPMGTEAVGIRIEPIGITFTRAED